MRIKLLVCCHKDVKQRNGEEYLYIHVGKALSECDLKMQGDNAGDNISKKNKNYCELTGLYWGWKNLHEVDVIGLCHYRRFFQIDEIQIKHLLREKKYDFIVAEHRSRPYCIADEIINQLTKEDFVILESVLKKKFPQYSETIDKYFYSSNKYYPYNMFVSTKEVADNYCIWLFGILFELEKYIRLSGYSRLKRIYGYLGEYLLTFYIKMYNLKVKEIAITNTDEKNFKIKHYVQNLYCSLKFNFLKINFHSSYVDVRQGLLNDGIEI